VDKYLKNKSVFMKNNIDNLDIISNNLELCDHSLAIILLTTMNNVRGSKQKNIHGYNMSAGIDVLTMVAKLTDARTFYEDIHGKERLKYTINELTTGVYKSLFENLETVKHGASPEAGFKISQLCLEQLSDKIYNITKYYTYSSSKKMIKTDVSTLNFKNKDLIKNRYSKLYRLEKEEMIKYIEEKFGSLCKLTLIMGWLLGGGDEKIIETLENLGTNLGYIMKIYYDFINIEKDIENASKITYNLIANIGVKESYILYIENKTSFIEGCCLLDIYSNTTKEILDIFEEQINDCLEKSNIDLRSTYSSFSSFTPLKI
jgi:hypothetical protein